MTARNEIAARRVTARNDIRKDCFAAERAARNDKPTPQRGRFSFDLKISRFVKIEVAASFRLAMTDLFLFTIDILILIGYNVCKSSRREVSKLHLLGLFLFPGIYLGKNRHKIPSFCLFIFFDLDIK